MRKESDSSLVPVAVPSSAAWLDLNAHARVRLTSEDAAWPIDSALQETAGKGWKAAQPGTQTMWIDFDTPQEIRELHVRFETTEERTQEFVLLSSDDNGRSYREIVRQQFNFSRSTRVEEETYFVHLSGITDLKLVITPDISGGDAHATLRTFRLR